MTCITSAGSYQGCQSHGCDASLRVSSNLFVVRHEYTHKHTHKHYKVLQPHRLAREYIVGKRVFESGRTYTQTQSFKHICTTAHTAAQSRRVATKLAEQTATACSLSSQGVCLLIHTSFTLSHNVKCLLVCLYTCVCVCVRMRSRLSVTFAHVHPH